MRRNAAFLLAFAGLLPGIPAARGQSFDEPSVMNQPYTQLVADPHFGDYEGTYVSSDMKQEDGGPPPVQAEAKVVPEGHCRYRVVLSARPVAAEGLPWQSQVLEV